MVMVFNATLNNISTISCRSVTRSRFVVHVIGIFRIICPTIYPIRISVYDGLVHYLHCLQWTAFPIFRGVVFNFDDWF
jgi:hypothetical protein